MTLNTIQSRLRSLALAHRQINHFYFGDEPEFDAQTDITFPGCFCVILPGSIDRINHLQNYIFRIYFLDLVHVAERTEENETEVLSDMDSVASDFVSMLLNPLYQDDWIVGDVTPTNPVTESLGDMVAGVFIDITLSTEYNADSCLVPADDVEFPQTIDMARTKIYKYTATGLEGNTISIPSLSGKYILALWRAMAYKRAIAVAPTDSEKIQVGTVDAGSGQGIVGDGSFILQTGDALIVDEQLDILYYGT